MPRARKTRPRVVVGTDMMKPEYTHLGSLTYEMRRFLNDVEGYIIDCAIPTKVFHLEDAVLTGMVQKDVNGDGYVDLQFRARSNPEIVRTVYWDRELNRFVNPEDE